MKGAYLNEVCVIADTKSVSRMNYRRLLENGGERREGILLAHHQLLVLVSDVSSDVTLGNTRNQ